MSTQNPRLESAKNDISEFLRTNYDVDIDLDSPPTSLSLEEMGLDSLALISLAAVLQSKYGIAFKDDDVFNMKSPDSLVKFLEKQLV